MELIQQLNGGETPKPKKSNKQGLSDAVIISAVAIILMSIIFNWMSDFSQPPEEEDFSEYSNQGQAYQDALNDHQDKVRAFEGIYSLFSSIGLVMLVSGLFYKTVNDSHHLPDWVRVAMMGGVMWFLIRLFTTELSLFDTIELLNLLD